MSELHEKHKLGIPAMHFRHITKTCSYFKNMKIDMAPSNKNAHIESLLLWVRRDISKGPKFWSKVIFFHEKLNMYVPDDLMWSWQDFWKDPERFSTSKNSAESLVIWFALSFNGIFEVTLKTGNHNAFRCITTLISLLLLFLAESFGNSIPEVVQQETSSIHTDTETNC